MKTLTSFSALLMAGALAACGNSTEAPETGSQAAAQAPATINQVEVPDWQESIAELEGLADEVFSLEGSLEADLSGINAAMPDLLSVSWDEKTYDAATGATQFTGLKVTIASDPELGIQAEEASVWGLNSALIAARMRGERLDEEGLAFNRLEASNVSYFGFAEAMNTFFDAIEEEIEEESDETINLGFESFDSQIGQMVMSNVALRAFEYEPLADDFLEEAGLTHDDDVDEDEAADRQMLVDALRLGQQLLAVGRSLKIDDVAAYDTTATFTINQPGMVQTGDLSWGFYGYEDLNGWDLGRLVVVDAVQSQSMTFTGEDGELAEAGLEDLAFDQVETMAFSSYSDIKLDKLAGFLARGEFPGMEERDLLSLGTWETRGYGLTVNEEDILSADEVTVDANSFAWFIPENISMDMTGVDVGVEAIGNMALAFIPAEAVGEDAGEDAKTGEEVLANLRKAVDKLDEHGLGTVPVDASAEWSWGTDSGETGLSLTTTSEGFGDGEVSLDLILPAYDALQDAYGSDDREGAFEEAFQQAFAFGGLRLYEADEGGYDKLFAYANDIAKLYPNEGWGAMLSNMEPAQIRTFLATMIRSGKGVAAQQFPPAADWVESVASYYEVSGGSLEIKSAPGDPVTMDELESLEPGETEPEEIVERLGLSVTHTPE